MTNLLSKRERLPSAAAERSAQYKIVLEGVIRIKIAEAKQLFERNLLPVL
jgi:hypothetical protein